MGGCTTGWAGSGSSIALMYTDSRLVCSSFSVLGQPGLQLRGERRAIADGGVPRQRVSKTLAVQPVAERVLAKPAFKGFLIGRLRRKLCHEQPAVACFAAQLVESAVGDDQTLPHDGDAVRHELGLAQHVGRDDQSRAASPLLTEEVAHVSRGNGVETCCRLVAENPVGFVQRGADQRDLLRHAAREGGKHGVRAIGQLEALQKVADSLASNRFGNAVEVSKVVEVFRRRVAAVKARLVGHDPEPRADLVKLVRQSKPVELDQARVRMQDAAEAAQRRGLARAVLPEDDQHLAALDLKVDAIDRTHVGEALPQALDPDHWSAELTPPPALLGLDQRC